MYTITPPLDTGTYIYRVEVTQNGVCTVTSGSVTVVVVADPDIMAIASGYLILFWRIYHHQHNA